MQAAPVMSAGRGSGGHEDPAWRVRWVTRGPERGEALVSTSTDGRVTQWATSKAGLLLPVINWQCPPGIFATWKERVGTCCRYMGMAS